MFGASFDVLFGVSFDVPFADAAEPEPAVGSVSRREEALGRAGAADGVVQ